MDNNSGVRAEKLFPHLSIGVMGSAGGDIGEDVIKSIRRLGAEIARRGYVLITGACPGIPQEAVKGAKEENGIVIGVSPALDMNEHVIKYRSPTQGYDAILYTGSGLMGREIENIRSCDVVIFAGGRSGTLGEFAIAYDEGKVIGVLEESGGITDHIRQIISMVNKDTGAIVEFDKNPINLLVKLEKIYKENILPQYLKIMEKHDPNGELNSG